MDGARDAALLRTAVVQLSHQRGFAFADEAALDGLTAAAALYLQDIGWRSQRLAELAGRCKVDVSDVREAMEAGDEIEEEDDDEEEDTKLEVLFGKKKAEEEDLPFTAVPVNALPAPRTPAPPEKGSKKSLRIRKPSKFVPFGWAVQRRGAAAANQAAELLLPPKVEPKKEKTEEKLEEKLEEVKEKEESEKEESEMEEKEEGEEEEEGEEGEEEEEEEDNDDDPTYSE
ncbi:unnamed protein product [Durusdinium trenchii]|uniref:Bromodomain associated domain-containing protein n=1 Tax=Durusdinium trenchii TaxID=1381693 RepID=A0ABP0R9J4_9DINO